MDVASMVYRRTQDGWFFDQNEISICLPLFVGICTFLYPVVDQQKLVDTEPIIAVPNYKLFFEGHIRYLQR